MRTGRDACSPTDALLDALSAMRRLTEQLVKANRLRSPVRAADIEAEADAASSPGQTHPAAPPTGAA
jgi:hypothetical protein